MTTYRLPDWLGGHLADIVSEHADDIVTVYVKASVAAANIQIARVHLIEAKPPLPPEPPAGSVVLDKDGDAWQREDSLGQRWAAAVFHESTGMFRMSWEELNGRHGPLRRLVPDPADAAPPLPWRKRSSDDRYPDLLVERARDAGDVLEINGFGLAQNQIRELMGICARHLKPGAERDALQAAAWAAREVQP